MPHSATIPASFQSSIAAPRRGFLRELTWASALTLLVMLPVLVSPPLRRGTELEHGVRTVYIAGPVHVNIGIDAPLFVLLASDPRLLLEPQGRLWQSRPLYPALGWTLARPFRAVGLGALGERAFAGQPLPRLPQSYGSFLPEFAGLIVLNGLLVAISVMLLRRLLDARSLLAPEMLLPATLLLANEVTKPGFWTPHLQMFNLLVPLATLNLLVWLRPRLTGLRAGHFAALGLALGVGGLAYGAFAIAAGAAALCIVLQRPPETRLVSRSLHALLVLAAFSVPMILWVAFVQARTGSFYFHETEQYRQFVWLVDAAWQGIGALGAALAHNLSVYLTTLVRVLDFPVLLLGLLWIAVWALGAAAPLDARERAVALAAALYVAVSVPFYALMGYYATRLTWTVVPALLPFFAFAVVRLRRSARPGVQVGATVAVIALAAGCYVYWVIWAAPVFLRVRPR